MSSSVGGGGGAGGGGADVGSLLEKAKELDQLKKEQEDVAAEINKIHKKVLACKICSLAAAPPVLLAVPHLGVDLALGRFICCLDS